MNEFTTIRISKKNKDKLEMLKGENKLQYDEIITKLIEAHGGTVIDDVITIPPAIAFTLNYWNKDNNESNSLDITFGDLLHSKIGDEFKAYKEHPSGYNWINSFARVIGFDYFDVILKVVETNCTNGEFSSIKSIVHVRLF